MIIKAEMDSKLFDANEELKKRNMRIEGTEKQNKMLRNLITKLYQEITGVEQIEWEIKEK